MVAVAPPDGTAASDDGLTDAGRGRFAVPTWLEHATMVVALLWWAWPLTTRIGGRGVGALTIGVLTVLPAVLVQRPWRRLPAVALALALAIPLAALLVCFLTPVGFAPADSAANY